VCLLIVMSRLVPDWPLIVAANRDERYERPTAALGPLPSLGPRTLGGTDLLAGGTWLAVNEAGVIAGLTNKPSPEGRDPTKRSRGDIPLALTSTDSAASAVASFETTFKPGERNPCWALVGDRRSLFYLDLTLPDAIRTVELPPGLYVLENRALGDPSAKVEHVRRAMGRASTGTGDVPGVLRAVLEDHTVTSPAPEDTEEARRLAQMSCCCVHAPAYGTRSSMLACDPLSPIAEPEVWASDGPSCVNPLRMARFEAQGPAERRQ